MTKRNNVENLFKKIEGFLDIAHTKAHEVAGDLVDSAFIFADEAIGEWKNQSLKLADEKDSGGKAEEVSVEPDVMQMAKDIDAYKRSVSPGASSWAPYINGDKELTDQEKAYTRLTWAAIPAQFKTYEKRNPDSPL